MSFSSYQSITTLNVLELFSAFVQLFLSLELFFKSLADLAFHQSWDVHPILPEFLCSIVSESLADYQCSLFNSLRPALLPEFISLCSSALLPTWQFQSFSMKCSVAQLQNRHSLFMGLDTCNRKTSRFFVRCLQWEFQLCSGVPVNFYTWVTLIAINSINSHFFRAENQ